MILSCRLILAGLPLLLMLTWASPASADRAWLENNKSPERLKSGSGQNSGALPLTVRRPYQDGSDISPESYDGNLADRDLSSLFKGLYSSALVGRYLDPEPARRRADELRKQGILAFVLKKNFRESSISNISEIGDFYVVMAGLFAAKQDADNLGQRLRAEGRTKDYRILPVDDPGDISKTDAQNLDLFIKSGELGRQTQDRAAKPLAPDSPARTGQAFKKHMRGSYIGSYRDRLEAREEARRLTAGGWPASVEAEGGWYRVYLAPTEDSRDLKADPEELKAAKASAASQPGFFLVVDTSSLRGSFSGLSPNAGRSDASACAGYSEAGRLVTSLRRVIIYIPETTYTVSLTPVEPQEFKWTEIPSRLKSWWDDEKQRPTKKSVYGPALYNRPELEKAVSGLKASPKEASLALGITEAAIDFKSAPGRKTALIFSEFKSADEPKDIKDAVARLKSFYGSDLRPFFIYGDTDRKGYELASELAAANGGQPWDGCRLLGDNAYFEKFIKTVFK